jgi:hypothetical protein
MILIIAALAFFGMSAVVVLGSISINRNIGFPTDLAPWNLEQIALRPTTVDFRFSGLARHFLDFRERYDTAWELVEGLLVACVFVLLFSGHEEEERFLGLFSHALVGVLLAMKFASLALARWARRHSPGQTLS